MVKISAVIGIRAANVATTAAAQNMSRLGRLSIAALAALVLAAAPSGSAAQAADAKIWDNYDFVPGSKVMFFTDFSEDRVGNFARGLKSRGGAAEIVERDGVKMLRATQPSEILI